MSQTQNHPDGSIVGHLGDAGSVLVLTPSMSGDEDGTCAELMTPTDVSDQNVLWISYTKSPDVQLDRFRNAADSKPANVGVVSVEDSTRSVAASAAGGGPDGPLGVGPVETISNPSDLTGIGISVTEFLKDWHGNGHKTVVCFDSLTAMLQYTEMETAYEFLHVLVGRAYAVDALVHFHMDPGAHDEQTVERVASLMDAVVELGEDGPDVRTR